MAQMDTMPVWPGWETVRTIGRGSFGAVYEIERDVLGEKEKAALKVITIPQSDADIREMYSDGYDDESITSVFREHLKSIVAEYSLMRKLNGSANVVNCDDVRYVQHDDGIGWDVFIKMELLTPLSEALPAEVPEEQAVRIAKDLCRALVQCRRFGIVHRDIKPQNIFVSPLGDYKLGDFGVAKTMEKTSGGTKIGTYKYMAPEVYNNQPYGAGADIYSLGLVLYWLLNEKRMPFLPLPPERLQAGMEEEARQRRFRGEPIPAPAHGSEELKRIVLKACAYDPQERYRSAEDMLRDLNALESRREPAAPPAKEDAEATVVIREKPGPAAKSEPKEPASPARAPAEPAPPAPAPAEPAAAAEHGPEEPKPRKKKKAWLIPVVVIAAAALALVLLLRTGGGESGGVTAPQPTETPAPTATAVNTAEPTPEPTASPAPASTVSASTRLSETELRVIPDWYEDDCVTVNGDQICFSRQNAETINGISINKSCYVYTYDAQGRLYDVRCFDLCPSVDAAEMMYEECNRYVYRLFNGEYDYSTGPTNCHGYPEGTAHYFRMDSVVVEVFEEDGFEDYFSGQTEKDSALAYWSDSIWEVHVIE